MQSKMDNFIVGEEKNEGEPSEQHCLSLEMTPERSAYSAGERNVDVLVTIESHALLGPAVERSGIDLIAVIDTSASMRKKNKMAYTKLTLQYIIDCLGAQDRLALVTFNQTADLVMDFCNVDADGKATASGIASALQNKTGSNMYLGLDLAFKTMNAGRSESCDQHRVCGVILLTDGLHNGRPRSLTVQTVQELMQGHGMTCDDMVIHTIAFGADHDIKLLKEIAEHTKASYSYIEDAKTISDAVAPAVTGLLSVVAQNSRLRIECCSADQMTITSAECGVYEHKLDERELTINSGGFYDGETRKFLFTCKLNGSTVVDDAALRIKCSLSYFDIASREMKTLHIEQVIDASQCPGEEAEVNVKVSEFKLELLLKDALSHALQLADTRKFERGRRILHHALKAVESYPHQVSEDFKRGILDELRVSLERMKELQRAGSLDVYEGKACYAKLTSASTEMSVQRASSNSFAGGKSGRFDTETLRAKTLDARQYFTNQ
eukprot:TRINITY_DN413_c0_g2_i1.p1 TRINITY_DN413_c0_g2~~TRINITY_DN413_c0_g2_i1.p1  ORF type:complete len:494 (-),score=97.30 TRINITY_DN413_c0_g2_i1:46-1527(-)